MLLGLTGGYCAGKNLVSAMLERRGFFCIDVDKLGHAALERSAAEVTALLGSGILDNSGKPDRKAIAALVFNNPELLIRYEAIVHPQMFELLDEEITRARADNPECDICLNAAVLYKMPHAFLCDAIIELRASLSVRVARAKKRDGVMLSACLKRIKSQTSLFALRGRFRDRLFMLDNSGSRGSLEKKLDRLCARFTRIEG
jgi:dephospho-CoA kinase